MSGQVGMESVLKRTVVVLVKLTLLAVAAVRVEANWCVARSDAGDQALQSALDYACSTGADCAPIQSTGLCYLPNTLQNHASYAFNSYYQRKNLAPGSCDFAGTATLAKTDPSYGSCVFPPNPSTAGVMNAPAGTGAPTTTAVPSSPTPTTVTSPTTGQGQGGASGQIPTQLGPPIPTTNHSTKNPRASLLPASLFLCIPLLFF